MLPIVGWFVDRTDVSARGLARGVAEGPPRSVLGFQEILRSSDDGIAGIKQAPSRGRSGGQGHSFANGSILVSFKTTQCHRPP